MSEQKSAEEQITRLKHDFTTWLQPLREWIDEGLKLNEIAQNTDLPSKKISLQKIFGSNLTLQSREARGVPKNQWLSLAVAKENLEKLDSSILLVRAEGIEPSAFPLSEECSTTELSARGENIAKKACFCHPFQNKDKAGGRMVRQSAESSAKKFTPLEARF